MRLSASLAVLATAFLLPATLHAEAPVPAATDDSAVMPEGSSQASPSVDPGAAGEVGWDQFDDPNFVPAAEPVAEATSSAESVAEAAVVEPAGGEGSLVESDSGLTLQAVAASEPVVLPGSGVVLGPEGVDDEGRAGRLHTVAKGDTLWDLSAAYLGTPWVWPSVWIDNDDIANPHLINPGDKIWITANEMRVVSAAEAESFLTPSDDTESFEAGVSDEMFAPVAALETTPDDPSTLDAFPVAVAGQEPETMAAGRQVTVSRRETMGFVTADDLAGASSLVGSPLERTFLASGDSVVVGMGEGDTEVGDQFTIFQVIEEVRDVETNRLLGHHVENLGWLEVTSLTGDTSIAEIKQSYSEIRRGVRVMPRKIEPRRVTTRTTPDAIEGQIVFLPTERTLMADGGYVYLNRGEFHGVEVGSELEVFDAGQIVNERARRVDVRTPDHSVARLIVVSVEPDSAVAFVLNSKRELTVGDTVRPLVSRLAQR